MKSFIPQIYSRILNKKAQSAMEQVFLFVLVASGIVIMAPYVQKAWNAGIKTIDDSIMDTHYDPLLEGTITEYCSSPGAKKDGGWSGWGPCICKPHLSGPSCGQGTCTLVRTCTNPVPACGGQECEPTIETVNGVSGERGSTMEINCDLGCCPVDGGWIGKNGGGGYLDDDQYWTKWSICIGCQQFRTKTFKDHCIDPRPSCGGKDCGISPIQWRSCGPIDGHYEKIVGPCVNCNRTITYHCTAQCGGAGCGADYTETEACEPASGICTPSTFCLDDDHAYSKFRCNNGTCEGYDVQECPDEYETECYKYPPSKCDESSGGCVPTDPTIPPAISPYGPINEGSPCEVGIVYCSSDGEGWYDDKLCVNGACTPPGTSYTECPPGVGTPGVDCNIIPHSRCNLALFTSTPKYCTAETYVVPEDLCGADDFCSADYLGFYADEACGPDPANPGSYACNLGANYTACRPTAEEAALLNSSSLDCIAHVDPSTCEDENPPGVEKPDGTLCIDTLTIADLELAGHICSQKPFCDKVDKCILHHEAECDGTTADCLLPHTDSDENCCGDEEYDDLHCQKTEGYCIDKEEDDDECYTNVTYACPAGTYCIPEACEEGQYDDSQCGSGKIWVMD